MEKCIAEKNRRKVIRAMDYDLYTIKLNFPSLFGSNREKIILQTLNQMHPCFSDDFCFDYKVRLSKKGFIADTVVINKLRFSELRNEYGKKLYIKEWKHFLFSKRKIFLSSVYLALLILISFGVIYSLINSKKKFAESVSQNTDNLVVTIQSDSTKKFQIQTFFEKVSKNDGSIDFLEWRCEQQKQNFTASLEGIYPELFTDNEFTFSSVSYKNEIPYFTVSLKNNINLTSQKSETGISSITVIPVVRDYLKKEGVSIYEENQNPFSIRFFFQNETLSDENIISGLSKICSLNHLNPSYISIFSINQGFEVKLNFSADQNSKIDLETIGKNLSLFKKEKITETKEIKKSPQKIISQTVMSGKKIGEVSYSDGSKLVFYKDEKGKINSRKEAAK